MNPTGPEHDHEQSEHEPREHVAAVVFDFGGVLITSITNQLGEVAETHDVDVTTMKRVLMGPNSSGDHPWHRAERGEIAVADIQGALSPWAAADEVSLRGDEIDRIMQPGKYTVLEQMVECVSWVREAGRATALLTNTFREFRPTMQRDLDFALFDTVIESFAVGARKPEEAIYSATERALGTAGATIAYLDDFEENLTVPRKRGWHTIHVADPDAAIRQLDALLT